MKELDEKPTIEQIELELKATIGGLAVLFNECFFPNSGFKMLGMEGNTDFDDDLINHIDLQKFKIARNLPVYYAYAYDGICIPGYEREFSGVGDNSELIIDFFHIFKPDGSYFDECIEAAAWDSYDKNLHFGVINDMLSRMRARSSLDQGGPLSIPDIAILANMNERSVKNAINADKDKLEINPQGDVENNVAKAWLNCRRGFVPTKFKDYPAELNVYPDDLTAIEIPAFIADRLAKIYAKSKFDVLQITSSMSPDAFAYSDEGIFTEASKVGDISIQELRSTLLQPLKLSPELIPKISKCIHVDVVWFNLQVMRALYPSQVDMLLNPIYFKQSEPTLEEMPKSIEVIVTENMIKHGYIDIPSYSKGIFPEGCFGTRSDESENQIKIIYGKSESLTDVRIKSEKTISFRKRFGNWFRDVQVNPGDRISITKVGDSNTNVYELVHIPK